MNPTDDYADRVRRWFSARPAQEPPTEDELFALARGDFEDINAPAIAAALATCPSAQRQLEEIQRFLDRSREPVGGS